MSNYKKMPSIKVCVFEEGGRGRKGWLPCEIGKNLQFSAEDLSSYFFSNWNPIVFDAFLLAAAVEFCDRTQRRPSLGWGRNILVRLPVHDPEKWKQNPVSHTLHESLEFLTGDCWQISFEKRKKVATQPQQNLFPLAHPAIGVVPFSEGLDSNAVGALLANEYGRSLVRVRLGKKNSDRPKGKQSQKEPFKAIPYKVRPGKKRFSESSVRSRGFKFAMLSGLAAYLSGAKKVFVPESGQGALGPGLVTVGQAYEDFRNHPRFTVKMTNFLNALLDHEVKFEFPRLWFTKGETLAAYGGIKSQTPDWGKMRSCWQDNRHVSVDHRRRQCGICAACMLRRLSMHSAKIAEPNSNYIWENLSAPTFEEGVAVGFEKITTAQRQYAIAGTLHLDHLASLQETANYERAVEAQSYYLSSALGIPQDQCRSKLELLLTHHRVEWTKFLDSLGSQSFVRKWLRSSQ